jgi:pyruvate dehydrogenase E1 component
MDSSRDSDPSETEDWLGALKAVVEHRGPERADFLLDELVRLARREQAWVPHSLTTAYVNTIPVAQQPPYPTDREIEKRVSALIRWNAMAIVLRANKDSSDLGGHIASYQSSATLYETGFSHFWHAPTIKNGGDLVFFQGHSAPGIYARAFLEGRLSAAQLDNFRRESGGGGLSSYPHPRLMPDFWQFPTVSMGLGPLLAIYQARFMHYLDDRGLARARERKVWCFVGDGECDEPESLGGIALAGREHLDNLIFVVNCNLQRLDGPVRGNGKIIQELEAVFRGAGWNVIKLIWGSEWDDLLARDTSGLLMKRMEECVDGEYQDFKSKDGRYVRQHFFGKYPELLELVAHLSDEQIWRLSRGGHDMDKVYAAYAAAVAHTGEPTVILAKTVKGYGMGESGEAQMGAHQAKKMSANALHAFRERFDLPIADDEIDAIPLLCPPEDSPEMRHLRAQRAVLGGYLPRRQTQAEPLPLPADQPFAKLRAGTGERAISTTMAFVQLLRDLVRDPGIGARIVPIVPDESRTFGMETMFRQLGIWSSVGQLYRPQDADQMSFYKESKTGQVLEEGINEAGAMASWIVAGTSYSSNGVAMIPFFILYSMFGFQRVGDLAWLAGDIRARGFILGATAGRTTLNGEGLQHQDGHSQVLAGTVPCCRSYDPAFAGEVAVLIREGLRRMYVEQIDEYWYLTLGNENYRHPPLPDGVEDDIVRGLYRLHADGEVDGKPRVQLMGSGAILNEVVAAAAMLRERHGVAADVWSATSFNELARDAAACERHDRLHPGGEARVPHVARCLRDAQGPLIVATDYIRGWVEPIRAFVGRPMTVLGTDGYGRSDTRRALRRFFEVDREHIVVAALRALADAGSLPMDVVTAAIRHAGIDADMPAPWTR